MGEVNIKGNGLEINGEKDQRLRQRYGKVVTMNMRQLASWNHRVWRGREGRWEVLLQLVFLSPWNKYWLRIPCLHSSALSLEANTSFIYALHTWVHHSSYNVLDYISEVKLAYIIVKVVKWEQYISVQRRYVDSWGYEPHANKWY